MYVYLHTSIIRVSYSNNKLKIAKKFLKSMKFLRIASFTPHILQESKKKKPGFRDPCCWHNCLKFWDYLYIFSLLRTEFCSFIYFYQRPRRGSIWNRILRKVKENSLGMKKFWESNTYRLPTTIRKKISL